MKSAHKTKTHRFTRRFTAAKDSERCEQEITYSDGSGARCMRAAKVGKVCFQHAKMLERLRQKEGQL